MHFPVGGEERIDIVWREEIRRAMRPVHHGDLPGVQVAWPIGRYGAAVVAGPPLPDASADVAGAQCSARVSAELPSVNVARLPCGTSNLDLHREIGALSGAAEPVRARARCPRFTSTASSTAPPRHRARLHLRAGERNRRIAVESQRRPVTVSSSPAAPSSLPSRRLASRNARSSIGPDGGADVPVSDRPG